MFGIISCADSLTAIKTLVYDEKKLFKGSMDKVEVVLKAFYDNDGVQTNLYVIGKDDLENAMVHPETTRTSSCVSTASPRDSSR